MEDSGEDSGAATSGVVVEEIWAEAVGDSDLAGSIPQWIKEKYLKGQSLQHVIIYASPAPSIMRIPVLADRDDTL